jgi:hypothetical protein
MKRRSLFKSFAVGAACSSAPLTALLARSAMAAESTSRLKTLFIFHPNGAVPEIFFPKPGSMVLPAMTRPMEAVKQHLLFIDGIGYAGKPHTHEGGSKKCLTGYADGVPATVHGLSSIDVQMGKEDWANREQTQITVPSIQMGCGTQWGDNFDKRVSFDKGRDLHAVDDPRILYPRIFGGSGGGGSDSGGANLKILDAVKGDLSRLKMKLGQVERERLEQHTDSLRVLEAKLTPTTSTGGGDAPSLCSAAPNLTQFGAGGNDTLWRTSILGAVSDVQQDIAIQSLACGVTRSIAFSYGVSVSPIIVPGTSDNDHNLSHQSPEQHTTSKIWWMAEITKFIQKMAKTPDGPDGSSLLDNTIIMAVSDLGHGNKHNHFQIPIFLAGGKNAGLITNRSINLAPFGEPGIKGDQDESKPAINHADILATIADVCGYKTCAFPTTKGRILNAWKGGDRP